MATLTLQAKATTEVSASVDKNPAFADESIVLTIVANGSVSADAFDPSALEQNFYVGNTSVSSQTSMINFETTRSTRWTTLLTPKAAGSVIIPAFTIDGVQSNPINLDVIQRGNSAGKAQRDVFITAQASASDVYVQQTFTLKVKLHLAAELKRGTLSEPKMTGAQIQQLGQDTESMEIIDGRRYRTFERVYLIKPESSGQFVLHSSMFNGEIITAPQRSLFASIERGKPVSVRPLQLDIKVKPIPENFTGDWLPSDLIVVEDNWPTDAKSYELGEPITRQITITAAGLTEEQLPEINFEAPEQIKIYPDQAQATSGVQTDTVISRKTQEFAIVPTQAGTYTIPELVIPWWNTKLNKIENAIIPAKTITINGVSNPTFAVNNLPQEPVQVKTVYNTSLQWLFLAGWLLTAFAWLYTAKLKGKMRLSKPLFAPEEKQNYLKLIAACRQGDGEKVLQLLPVWASELYQQNLSNLTDVQKTINDVEFDQQLTALQKQYYSHQSGQWDGTRMHKVLSRLQTKTTQKQHVEIALNP